MARIRAIKPEFWLDEEIASWPPLTRLTYIALWNEADDEGRLRANAAYLKNRIFPYEPKVDIEAALSPLIESGKLVIYMVGAQTFGFLPKFRDHQVINRPSPSKLPGLDEGSLKAHGGLIDDSLKTHAGKEGKGRERNGRRRVNAPPVETEWLGYVQTMYPDWPTADALSAHGWYESKAWHGVKDWRACVKTCYYRWAGRPVPRNGRPSAPLIGAHKAERPTRDIGDAPDDIREIHARLRRREATDDEVARLDTWVHGGAS